MSEAMEIKLGTPSAKLGPAPVTIPPPPPWIAEALAAKEAAAAAAASASTVAETVTGDVTSDVTSDVKPATVLLVPDGGTAPKVTMQQIETEIEDEFYITAAQCTPACPSEAVFQALSRVTLCVITMRNNTVSVGVNYGTISPENYDPELGRQMAREEAIRPIWGFLGYEMRTKLAAAAS